MNVLLISSSDGIALALLRCLSLKHARTSIISVWKTSRSSKLSRYCARYVTSPVNEKSECLKALVETANEFCAKENIDAILPAGILGTFVLARIRKDLKCSTIFPTPSTAQILDFHDKWKFYAFMSRHALPTPRTWLIESPDDLADCGDTFPLIVKPLDLGNSEGVRKIDSAAALASCVEAHARSGALPLLAQEFVPGRDIVFGVLAREGEVIAWTLHEKTRACLRFIRHDGILEVGRAIVRLSHFSGAANFDVRLDDATGRISFIECNPRIWASTPLSVHYGVDFLELGIQSAQGRRNFDGVKTGVEHNEDILHPRPSKLLKRMITRMDRIGRIPRDLAWQALIDPLPTLKEMLWERLRLIDLKDSAMMTKLHHE